MIDHVIYFDNAATSWPKPPVVAEAMVKFLAEDAANPGRAGHRMAVATERMLDRVRKQLADLVGGTDFHRMVFTMNGTDALNIAIKGLLRAGDHVVTTALEHNSVSRPLQAMADSGFITLTRVGYSPATGVIDVDEVRRAIGSKTRMVAMTHASNVLGTIQPVAEVGTVVREAGGRVRFLVDAAQTIGALKIDVGAMGIDLLAFPGHKSLLGPTGTGGLFVNSTVSLDELAAFREGGTGGDSSSPVQPREWPYLLEGGTPNTVGVAGLGAAVDFIAGHPGAWQREQEMVAALLEMMAGHPKFRVLGPKGTNGAKRRVGTVSFNVEGYTPQEVGSVLDERFSIAVRPGLHCAPYAHRGIGTFPDGAVRVSPGVFNTAEDLKTLLDALEELVA